jgi:hypothetical protein
LNIIDQKRTAAGLPAHTHLLAGDIGVARDWLENAPLTCQKGSLSGTTLQDCKTWLSDQKESWLDDCNANAAQGFPCQKWADQTGQQVLNYLLSGHF